MPPKPMISKRPITPPPGPARPIVTLQAVERLMESKFATLEHRLTAQAEQPEREQIVAQLTEYGWTAAELAPMPLTGLRKISAATGLGPYTLVTQSDDGPDDDPKE